MDQKVTAENERENNDKDTMGTIASESPANNLPINIPAEQMIKFLSRYKNLNIKSTNRNEVAAKSPCKRLKLSTKKVEQQNNHSSTINNSLRQLPHLIGSFDDYLESDRIVQSNRFRDARQPLEESRNKDLYRHNIFSSSSKYCRKNEQNRSFSVMRTIQDVDKEGLEESSNDDPN